jgi:hypothetical protein
MEFGWDVEMMGDADFAGVEFGSLRCDMGRKKDHWSQQRYRKSYDRSHWTCPLLVSITLPRHTTHRICLHNPIQLRTPARKRVIQVKSSDDLTLGGELEKRIRHW